MCMNDFSMSLGASFSAFNDMLSAREGKKGENER